MEPTQSEDEVNNQILALGAIWTLLDTSPYSKDSEFIAEIQSDHPSLTVRMPFLRSAYKLTVERIPNDDDD